MEQFGFGEISSGDIGKARSDFMPDFGLAQRAGGETL